MRGDFGFWNADFGLIKMNIRDRMLNEKETKRRTNDEQSSNE